LHLPMIRAKCRRYFHHQNHNGVHMTLETQEITDEDLSNIGSGSEHYANRQGVDLLIRKLITNQKLMALEITDLKKQLASKYSRGGIRR